MALLGTYTVADDDSYARLDVLKEYDGQHEAYDYVTSGTFVTNLRYNQGLQKYVLPMTQYVEDLHGNISFDVYLTLSNDLPEPANLPEDPNGETFDPAYQVYKDVWDRLFVERGLIHASTSNYKVTHDTTIFEVDDGDKFYEHWTTGAPNSGYYWERTSIVGNTYYYNHTIVAGGEVQPASPVNYGIDFFDSSIGLAPIPFNWMSYNSVGHYYYRNSFTYQNSWTGSVTVNNYRVYFGQYYRVLKITYEDSSHQSYEFNFSNYNQVEIDIPEAGGGGGGGDPSNPSSYLPLVRNTVFDYNRVSGNYLSDEDKVALGSAYSNASIAIFNDDSVQFSTSAYYDENDDLVNSSLVLYGTLSFTNAGTESNGRTYVQGSIAQQYVMIGGTTYTANGTTTVRYYPNNDEFRITQHYDGDPYYIYLALTNESPVVIPHGDPTSCSPTVNYLDAKTDFENATGIGLPTVNNLDAYYTYDLSEHYYEFRTDSGAPLGTFEVFEDYLDENLSADWSKGNLEEPSNAMRYLYSHTNGDSIELYFATDDNYIVVTYSEYVGGGGGGGGGTEVVEAAYPSMYQLQTDDPYFTKIYRVTDPSADVEWVHEESSGTIGPNITENCEVIYPTSEDDFLIRYRFSCDVAVKDKNFFFSVNGSRIYPIVDESIDEISAYNNFDVVYDETEEEVLLIAQENIIDAVTYLTVYFDHYEAAQVAESAHTVHHVNEPSASITGFPPGEGNTYCAIWTFVEYGEWTGNWNRPEDGDPGFVRSTLKVFFRVTFNNNGTLTLESGDPDTMEASATWSNVPYTQVEGGYEFTINLAEATADYFTQMMFQYYASSSSYTGIAQPCSGNKLGGMDGIAQLYKEINYKVWYELWQDLNG